MIQRYHQLKAWLGGYFWLPCPRCGEYFGGHELDEDRQGDWWTSASSASMCCPRCCDVGVWGLDKESGRELECQGRTKRPMPNGEDMLAILGGTNQCP